MADASSHEKYYATSSLEDSVISENQRVFNQIIPIRPELGLSPIRQTPDRILVRPSRSLFKQLHLGISINNDLFLPGKLVFYFFSLLSLWGTTLLASHSIGVAMMRLISIRTDKGGHA